MDPSGRGQRFRLVRLAGLMNGSQIAAQVMAGSHYLCAGIALSEDSRLRAQHKEPMAKR